MTVKQFQDILDKHNIEDDFQLSFVIRDEYTGLTSNVADFVLFDCENNCIILASEYL